MDPIIEAAPAPTCLHAALIRHEQVRDLQIPMTEREHQRFPETHVQERGCHRCSNTLNASPHISSCLHFLGGAQVMQGHSVAGNSRELSVTSQEVESCPWSPQGCTSPPWSTGPSRAICLAEGKTGTIQSRPPRGPVTELHCLEAALLPCRLVLSQSGGHPPPPMPQFPPTCG